MDDDVVARVFVADLIAGGTVCVTSSISDEPGPFATYAVACSCVVPGAIAVISIAKGVSRSAAPRCTPFSKRRHCQSFDGRWATSRE
jgi:hypothetical protein